MKKGQFLKGWSVILALVTIFSLLTGCGGGKAGSQPAKQTEGTAVKEQPGQKENVTIEFWHHYNVQSEEYNTLTNVVLPEFEKKYPHIKVKSVSNGWEELHKKVLISASSNQLPDVIRSDIAWVPEFQKMNILVALDKDMPDFQAVADSLLEGPMNTAKIKGNYYGLALNTNTKVLFYNKELFDKAGIPVPKTLDEFFSAAKALTKEENGKQIWGYGEPALSGWNICPFIRSNGGDITDPEYKKASGYVNGPESVEIIQRLADLYKEEAMRGFNSGDIPLTDGYGSGRYAMIIEGPWKFSELAAAFPDFKPEVAQMPTGKASAQVLGGEDILMFTTAKKDAAWEFMKYMVDQPAQVAMAKAGQIPVNKAAVDSEEVRAIKNFAPFLEAIKTAKPRPPVSTWSEIDKVLTSQVTLAITGQVPVKEAMDEAAKKIDKLLAEQ